MVRKEATVEVYLQPGAKSNEIVGFRDGVLYVRVTAPPRKGQANQALLALMARALVVSKDDLAIIRGYTSRRKVLAIHGLDLGKLKCRGGFQTRPYIEKVIANELSLRTPAPE